MNRISSPIARRSPRLARLALAAGLALGLGALAPEALAASLTFAPVADTRVDAGAPYSKYGTSSTLRTDGGSTPEQSMLRFAVSGVGGPVAKATLRLRAKSSTADGPAVYATSSTWSESTMSWSTRVLPAGSPSADAGAIASGAWAELDVTKLVGGNGTWSFVLTQGSADGIDFASRHTTTPPQLVVSWADAAPACATNADCADGNACTQDTCTAGACQNTANPLPCNADGNACTADVCSAGACVAGPAQACSDGDACTADSCDAATGACVYTPLTSCPSPTPTTSPTPTGTPVPLGATWRYLDTGADLGTAWRAPGYADTAWKSGAAPLGYGNGNEKTVVSYGSSSTYKHVTTYFRRAFQVADPKAYASLALRLQRDDGAIVYLNGTEVFRSNMPTGAVSATTLAAKAIDDDTLYSAQVPVALLAAGTNVLAVEVHQAGRSSSDIRFDLELTGVPATTTSTTTPTTTPTTTTEPAPTTTCPALPANGSPGRGLWAWTSSIASSTTERDKFLAFAQARGVRAVYMSGPSITSSPSTLGAFVALAGELCVEVDLLYGKSDWALTANHGTPVSYAQAAVAAVAKIAGPKPLALHYDVEPYLLSQWSSDMNSVANQYLDLLDKLRAVAHGGGLKLTVDIPFWFDGKLVTRNGVTRPLSELVQDRVDRVTLMDYRDTASEIIAMGAAEVAYAAKVGKEVVLGVETMCGLSPTSITFCEEGRAALDSALKTVHAYYQGKPGYAGVAVHHYGSYSALPQ